MGASLTFRTVSGTDITENEVISFRFRKDAYTPYTSLTASFISHNVVPDQITEIKLFVNGHLIHHGTADSLTAERSGTVRKGRLSSLSFSSMLIQNQLKPGLYTNISINQLMDNMLSVPYVTHESDADNSGYIYVGKGASLWDGIVNLCYKSRGRYPYIRGTNCVMFSTYPQPLSFTYSNEELLSEGSSVTEKRLISDLHMADINEEYGHYDLTDPDVTARNIIRQRYFDLDMQFLYDPVKALAYRSSFAARGWRRYYCSYSGYKGEDIGDTVSFGSINSKPVGAVMITGGQNGIITEISVFDDKFYSV